LIEIGMGKDPLNPLLNLAYCEKEGLLGRIIARHPQEDFAIWISNEDSKGKFYSENDKTSFLVKRGEKYLIVGDENHYPLIMERWNVKALYGMESVIPGVYHGKGNPVCSVCHAMPAPTPENTPCPVWRVVLRGKIYEKLKWTEDWEECKKPSKGDSVIDNACGDCNTSVGSYHHVGCDMERCPRCKEQFIGCGCAVSEEALKKIEKETKEWFKTAEKGKKYKVVKSKTQSKTAKKYDLLTGWGTVLEFNKSEKEIIEIFIHKKNMSAEITFDDFSKHLENNEKTTKIQKFWNEISDFEIGEIKNESSNLLLAEARAGARMEVYVNMFYEMVWSSV